MAVDDWEAGRPWKWLTHRPLEMGMNVEEMRRYQKDGERRKNWVRELIRRAWEQMPLGGNLDRSGIPVDVVPGIGVELLTRKRGCLELTLTSSNGALPMQTTAPLAAPAIRLVRATSRALSRFKIPRWTSTQGFFSVNGGQSCSLSTVLEGFEMESGTEFNIRLVAV